MGGRLRNRTPPAHERFPASFQQPVARPSDLLAVVLAGRGTPRGTRPFGGVDRVPPPSGRGAHERLRGLVPSKAVTGGTPRDFASAPPPSNGDGSQTSAILRLALSPDEAAQSLGVSRDYFDEHILPELRHVRRGRRRLVPVYELEAWLRRSASLAVGSER